MLVEFLGSFCAISAKTRWTDWANVALEYQVRIIDWPNSLETFPGAKGWAPGRVNARELKILFPGMNADGERRWRIVKWDPGTSLSTHMRTVLDKLSEEQDYAAGGDTWAAIPTVQTVSGKVLLRVHDGKASSSQG